MTKPRKKLIIWDFDGVIADTEIIWQKIRIKKFNEHFGINWTLKEANHYIGGMSDLTKNEILEKMGYNISPEFWEEVHRADDEVMAKGFERTSGIDDIFENKKIRQCIATGGNLKHTLDKCKITGVDKWFKPDQVFTVDMVVRGKPEPDLFLVAAKKMGCLPEECLVIEDSIAGLTAAQKAGMTPIAFIGSVMNNNPEYVTKLKALGIIYIFNDMREIKKLIEEFL